MSMQTDVKAVHSSASTLGTAVKLLPTTGPMRGRIKGVVITGGLTAGTATFYDGNTDNSAADTSAVLLILDSAANSNMTNVLLPGEGILFNKGLWYTPTTTAPFGVTVIYG